MHILCVPVAFPKDSSTVCQAQITFACFSSFEGISLQKSFKLHLLEGVFPGAREVMVILSLRCIKWSDDKHPECGLIWIFFLPVVWYTALGYAAVPIVCFFYNTWELLKWGFHLLHSGVWASDIRQQKWSHDSVLHLRLAWTFCYQPKALLEPWSNQTRSDLQMMAAKLEQIGSA